jgi:multiple sugar transport system permease protein
MTTDSYDRRRSPADPPSGATTVNFKARRTTSGTTPAAYGFTAPYLALLAVFGVVPVFYAIWSSLRGTAGTGSFNFTAYGTVFHDFRFLPAVAHVSEFMAIWIPVMLAGSVCLALLLHERAGRLSTAMRLIYFLPGAVTGAAAVLLWYFMLDPQLSPFSAGLKAMGWKTGNQVFTGSHLAPIFALIAFMTGVGNWIVIMFGALQSLPHDVIEAARVDGAGPIRIAVQVKLPLISKYLIYMVILSFAAGLQIFVEPMLFYDITYAGSAWWSLNQLGYSYAFDQNAFGQAATVSVVLLAVSALAAFLFITRSKFFQTEVGS